MSRYSVATWIVVRLRIGAVQMGCSIIEHSARATVLIVLPADRLATDGSVRVASSLESCWNVR